MFEYLRILRVYLLIGINTSERISLAIINLYNENVNVTVPVKVLAESAGYPVESNRVDTGVDECETEADDPEVVPELVVVLLGVGIIVEPEHEHMMGEEADGEDNDESEDSLGNLLAGLHLSNLSSAIKDILINITEVPERQILLRIKI